MLVLVNVLSVSLLCLVTLSPSAPAQQKSIWDSVGIKRTGANGFEEYLDAIDLYRASGIDALQNERGKALGAPTDLQLCAKIEERMLPIMAKLQAGNAKRVFDPRQNTNETTLYPELAYFKSIAKGIDASCDSKFARGATSAAVSDLLIGLDFADNGGRANLIAGLVSMADSAILLRTFDSHIGQITQPDAKRITQFVDNLLSRPNMLAQVLQIELREASKAMRKYANLTPEEWKAYLAEPEGELDDEAKRFLEMAPADRANAATKAAALIDQLSAAYQKALVEPEKQWTNIDISGQGGPEKWLAERNVAVIEQSIRAFVIRRTQFRLLRLHAAIKDYRFERGKLPESLEALRQPVYILDPLVGESFTYKINERFQYELFSKGNDQTGKIELFWKQPKPEETFNPNLPPAGSRGLR